MLRWLLVAGLAAVAVPAHAAPQKLFIDDSREELIQAVPEFASLNFESNQTALAPLLQAAGLRLRDMLAAFVPVSIAEETHEMRFDSATETWSERRETFRYLMQTAPPAESRRQPQGLQALLPDPRNGFITGEPFLRLLSDLLPDNQETTRFRYLGRVGDGGRASLVVTFAARDESRQGLLWFDEETKRVVRLRADVLKHDDGARFDSFSTDARFAVINFPALDSALWLPASVVVHAHFGKGELHRVSRFSDYRVDGFEHDTDPVQLKEDTGEPSKPPLLPEDGFETLLRGVAALRAEKPAEALVPLREAVALLPARIEPTFYLGLAWHRIGNLAAAEKQFRQVTQRSPDFAAAHNELGAVLYERGDFAGAVGEFREAARLEPANANVRANLNTALRNLGSRQIAAAAPPAANPGDVTIKVDVRQVLVPVVVTNKEGHHVTGLTQADFKVFEDGVEQKISAFASERSDIPGPENPAVNTDKPAQTGTDIPKQLAKRHVYIICIDTMHASFGNFVHVREALQKLFEQEQAGDSQYAVLALGRSMQIVQNTTSDPAKVLESLRGPVFRKTFLQGQQASAQVEMNRFERTLSEVRALCDSPDRAERAQCASRKLMLPSEADRVADFSKLSLTQFLTQLRSVVEQLARGEERKTLVLISDGFPVSPGRPPYALLSAYFPDLSALRGNEGRHDAIDTIFKSAAKGNVPIYTIDSRGLYTSPAFDASRPGLPSPVAPQVNRALEENETENGMTLSEMAAATGGTAFHNNNDLEAGLKRAFADGREYYLLAYVPSNAAQDGKFRKIEVQLVNKKASLNAKRGYWASP